MLRAASVTTRRVAQALTPSRVKRDVSCGRRFIKCLSTANATQRSASLPVSRELRALGGCALLQQPRHSLAFSTASAELPEYTTRAQKFLQFLRDGVADMQESNPGIVLDLVPAEGASNGIGELSVFVSDEVGTYTFQPDVDAQEMVMISPVSGCVRLCVIFLQICFDGHDLAASRCGEFNLAFLVFAQLMYCPTAASRGMLLASAWTRG